MLRFLADESFPGSVIAQLRAVGHDVVAVKTAMRGASDAEVLAAAQSQSRIVLTFDKGFGELAFRFGLPATSGVILFRLTGQGPEIDNARALAAISTRVDWAGHFSTVTDSRIRIRALSPARSRHQ